MSTDSSLTINAFALFDRITELLNSLNYIETEVIKSSDDIGIVNIVNSVLASETVGFSTMETQSPIYIESSKHTDSGSIKHQKRTHRSV